MLLHLLSRNIGWAKNMKMKLEVYELESDWEIIKQMPKPQWKRLVEEAVNKRNKEKLINSCITKDKDNIKINTKTRKIHEQLTNSTTTDRHPVNEIIKGNKQRAKTIILARHGMLECGNNYKGTMSQICPSCRVTDDEDHRLNECILFKDTNRVNKPLKSCFEHIYSNDDDTLNTLITDLENIWEFHYANGRMKKTAQ